MQWEQNFISSSSSSWLRHKTQETIARKNKIANNTLLVIYLFILFICLFIYFIYFFICLFLWLFIYLLLFLLFFFSSAIKIMPSPGVEPGLPKPQSGVLPLYYKGLQLYWKHLQAIPFRRRETNKKFENNLGQQQKLNFFKFFIFIFIFVFIFIF